MGMFDYVACDYPLPGDYKTSECYFQTKDYESKLWRLRITADGYLMRREISGVGESIAEMYGEQYSEDELLSEEQEGTYHGDMVFYDGGKNFVARFWRGRVQHLNILIHAPTHYQPCKHMAYPGKFLSRPLRIPLLMDQPVLHFVRGGKHRTPGRIARR